ncbi:DUF2252 domain-containing protein [Arthrobacter sp.]|uniref:DUF2252 domain-containing protein n=1 Tax=Arthrobacter sp. TaxID=1667 RepID=UPI0026E0C44B|nr:DUF2252 domain-containing protein [Arthrobacter sp.]MDO5753469.1 DUF2252 domain-containing protein [Arthrobacter sp.]
MAVTTSISPVQFDVNSSLSTAQRQTQGRAARDRIHPAQLGDWNPQSRGHDALETILAQSAIRQSDLLPIRHGRMSASAWTYYRGAAAVAAADLGSRPNSGLTVQMCGDAHILNFGLWATPERNLSFDLRDFDETLPGPFEWDVSRLVASIVVLARDSGLKQTVADRAVAACLAAYRARMAKYSTAKQLFIWYDKVTVDDLIGVFTTKDQKRASSLIAKSAVKKTSAGAAKKLIEKVGGRLQISEQPPTRTHLKATPASAVYNAYRESLEEDRRHLLDGFTPQDAVQQIVGVGSVGMRVYLLLLNGCHDNDPLFLQIKQAGPSVYEPFAGASVHTNHGQRVVTGQRLIQSATDIFVGWTSDQGLDFYVRQFRDMKVIADAEILAPRLVEFATACGGVLARSHARSGDPTAINAYIGKGRKFDEALGRFAVAYADQTAVDHQQLVDAVKSGAIASAPG